MPTAEPLSHMSPDAVYSALHDLPPGARLTKPLYGGEPVLHRIGVYGYLEVACDGPESVRAALQHMLDTIELPGVRLKLEVVSVAAIVVQEKAEKVGRKS